jgi:ABC-type branched-chain amino acid transport systems, periplasmic component
MKTKPNSDTSHVDDNDATASPKNNIKTILEEHRISRRKFLQGTAAATAALSIGPFFLRETSAAMADEWKIGTIFPLTGGMAYGGNEGMTGCDVALAMVNEQGGVNTLSGKKKIVFARANAPDQTAATSEMNRLIANEGVKLVTGSFSSAIAYTASAVSERNKVLFWEGNAVVTDLTRRGFQYLFRCDVSAMGTGGNASIFTAEYVAPRINKDPKDMKVGVVWEDGTYGTSVHEGIVHYAKERGMQIVADEAYSAKSTDLSPVVLKLKAAKPDAILVAAIGADAIVLTKQLRDLDVNVSAIVGTSGGFGVPGFAQNMGKASNGLFSSDFPCDVNPQALSPKALAFRKEFISRYAALKNGGFPSGNAWLSFSATMLLFDEVLPLVKNLDPDEIKAAALSLDLPEGSMANGCGVKFIPHNLENGGHNERSFSVLLQWLDGRVHVVWPDKYANRPPEYVPLPTWAERERG